MLVEVKLSMRFVLARIKICQSASPLSYQIFMIGGILFFIAEFKLEMSLDDNLAQLFVEILGVSFFFWGGDLSQCSPGWYPAAAKANETVDFANLRIYGLLTDLIDFHFYSYNPIAKEFAFDETLVVNVTRDVSFTDMIPGMCFFLCTWLTVDQTHLVSNKIFSVILTAYIDGVEATMLKSRERKEKGDVSDSSLLSFRWC